MPPSTLAVSLDSCPGGHSDFFGFLQAFALIDAHLGKDLEFSCRCPESRASILARLVHRHIPLPKSPDLPFGIAAGGRAIDELHVFFGMTVLLRAEADHRCRYLSRGRGSFWVAVSNGCSILIGALDELEHALFNLTRAAQRRTAEFVGPATKAEYPYGRISH